MLGQNGADEFRFQDGFGTDTILDFVSGTDVARFMGVTGLNTFDDLAFETIGGTLAIRVGSDIVKFEGFTDASQLSESDFLFV